MFQLRLILPVIMLSLLRQAIPCSAQTYNTLDTTFRPILSIGARTYLPGHRRPWRHRGLIIDHGFGYNRPSRIEGLCLSILNGDDTLNGVAIAIAGSIIHNGFAVAPFGARADAGLAIGMYSSVTKGVSIGPFAGLVPNGMGKLGGGVAIGPFVSISGRASGVILGALVGDVWGKRYNQGRFYGLAAGLATSMHEVRGVQIGLVNSSNNLRGLQFGLLNIIKNNRRHKVLPLVNWGSN